MHTYNSFKHAVEEEHGELHCNVPERDDELEIRKGQVIWHDDEEKFTLTQYGEPIATFDYEDISAPYKPQEIWH